MKLISIIVPCYNEEDVIAETYLRLNAISKRLEFDMEIIFVNDGSQDKTLPILVEIAEKSKNIKVINFSRNFGHQLAITAGMDYAEGDAIVVIDADLQDPVEVILDMVEQWKNGYEIVYGKRIERKGETIFKKLSAKIFYKLLRMLSHEVIPVDVGDFRLIDRKVADALIKMPERSRYVRGLIAWLGFKATSVEYAREPRFAGQTKYPLSKMLKLGLDGIFSFSYRPLKIASVLGGTVSGISFLYLIYIIIQKLINNTIVSGWASLMVVLLFMSGMILLILGIIGEYIARIYEEVKARPQYVITNTIGISNTNSRRP
jgi:polyisoprenyl-phosphate glycosyltransferase